MKSFLIAVVVVAAAVIGYAVFSGNANLTVTEQGQKNLQQIRDTTTSTAKETADGAGEALEDLVREGKKRVHEATK